MLKTTGTPGGNPRPEGYIRALCIAEHLNFLPMTLCKSFRWTPVLALGLGLASCGGADQSATQLPATDTLAVKQESDAVVKVGGKLFSIPSPIQTVMLVSEMKVPYANGLALPTENATRFATKEKQALALGVYGADMAYAVAYKDGQRALKTLKTLEQLSGQLNLSNAFSKEEMDAFKKNINNQDSLLRLTGKAFRSADRYLKNEQRDEVSAWVLAGGWIEGLYLTLGASGDKLDPRVTARMAEQRRTLDNLIALLAQHEGSTELLAQLKDLAGSYAQVGTTYKYVAPKQDAANRTTYLNSTTTAQVAPEVLQAIITKVKAIRTAITA